MSYAYQEMHNAYEHVLLLTTHHELVANVGSLPKAGFFLPCNKTLPLQQYCAEMQDTGQRQRHEHASGADAPQ